MDFRLNLQAQTDDGCDATDYPEPTDPVKPPPPPPVEPPKEKTLPELFLPNTVGRWLEYIVGQYEGGGLFELFVPVEFTDNNTDLVIPNNFEPGFAFNFSKPSVLGHEWMYEYQWQWHLGERNIFAAT